MVSEEKVSFVKELIEDNKVVIFSKTYCPYCKATLKTFNEARLPVGLVRVLQLDKLDDGSEIQDALYELNGQKTVPNIYILKRHIGGNSELQKLKHEGVLEFIMEEVVA